MIKFLQNSDGVRFSKAPEAVSIGLDGDRCLRTKTAKPLPCVLVVLVVLVFRCWPQVDLGIPMDSQSRR